ncbi:hypothetical protein UlMin_025435 [Ulmus minor]
MQIEWTENNERTSYWILLLLFFDGNILLDFDVTLFIFYFLKVIYSIVINLFDLLIIRSWVVVPYSYLCTALNKKKIIEGNDVTETCKWLQIAWDVFIKLKPSQTRLLSILYDAPSKTQIVSSVCNAMSSTNLKIGIVGFGSFAQFLAKTILKQGHVLRATSRTDYSELCLNLGVSFFRNVEAFLEADNDVVLICTSILSLTEILKSMPFQCLKKPTLFVDVLSVKEHPKEVLLQVLPEESDVLCTHPMFGPESGKNGWKDLTFVYERVRIRNQDICSSFLQIFQREGCRMLEMSCEEHDKLAARSQFLTHTIGRVLSEMEIQSTPMNTKGFETLIQLKESTIKDSFDLFSGLFVQNKFAKQELENLELAFKKVKQTLLDKTIDVQDADGDKL